MQSWVLIGMMGAGKSSVGRKLASLADRDFLDTDQLIQNRLGRSIEKIFQLYGEEAFRDHETSVIQGLSPGLQVISTGGGAILREANWEALSKLGTTIYLKSSPETLIARLVDSKKKRPLLDAEDWEVKVRDILSSREHLYARATLTVDLDQIPLDVAAEAILKEIEAIQ